MSRARKALGALLLGCSGCLAPPALFKPPGLDTESVRSSLSLDARRIEVRLADDTCLAGWYVPADVGAPLVLSLLESGASVDSTRASRAHLVRQLADLGFASLLIDYTGVGASSGKRSTRNLARDAEVMWKVALELVDDDPGRVVVRATSLGTLAALSLIEGGARPAGVILLLPVMPDTVTARFGRSFYGVAGWLAAHIFQAVIDLEPTEVIASAPLHWMLVQADAEQLTSPEERSALTAAVERQGGSIESLPYDHYIATIALLGLSPGEIEFLTEVVPGVRDGDARWARFEARRDAGGERATPGNEVDPARLRAIVELAHNEDPMRLVAAAKSGADPMSATRVRWLLARRPGEVRDLEGLEALADLDDPAGPLPLDLLEEVAAPKDLLAQVSDVYMAMRPELIEAAVRAMAVDGEPFPITITVVLAGGLSTSHRMDLTDVYRRLMASGLVDGDARRQLARLMLKADRYPDRVVERPDGGFRLEYRARGDWVAMELSPRNLQESVAVGTDGWLFSVTSPRPERP
ncbi:MAG TPA: hypothetical protein VMT18_10340 [Planctomycetota bacterium]|nr:hypothetical protein [Planctomycetota bacterium]